MKTIREIVAKNLVNLRKQNNLTQIELSEKITYSDKAISRWEKGEVTPSLEVLEQLSELYKIPVTYFFEEHLDEETKAINSKTKTVYFATILFMSLIVWTIAVLVFFCIQRFTNIYRPIVFIWATPLTAFIVHYCLSKWYKNKFYIITASISSWTTIAAIYLQWLHLNIWPIFLLGIPVQITIILITVLKKLKNQKNKLKKK